MTKFKRKLSEAHKKKISEGLRKAWSNVPKETVMIDEIHNKNNQLKNSEND